LVADRNESAESLVPRQLVVGIYLGLVEWIVADLHFDECSPLFLASNHSYDSIRPDSADRGRAPDLERNLGVTADSTSRPTSSTDEQTPELGYGAHHG
jgi:hypothetical protein